jgi:hypothetical protein
MVRAVRPWRFIDKGKAGRQARRMHIVSGQEAIYAPHEA